MILWNYDNFTNNNITTEQQGYKNSRSKLNKSPAWHANSFIISSSYVNTIFRETKPSEISKIYYILKLGYTQKRKNKKRSNKSWRTSNSDSNKNMPRIDPETTKRPNPMASTCAPSVSCCVSHRESCFPFFHPAPLSKI